MAEATGMIIKGYGFSDCSICGVPTRACVMIEHGQVTALLCVRCVDKCRDIAQALREELVA